MNSQNEINPKKTARMAGFLYLFIAVCGGFAFFAGYETLIVAGDATATINNMVSSEFIFRIGMVGDALTFLGEIVLTVLLYSIFKPVNKTLSLVAAYARLAMTAMIGVNMLNKMVALHLLSGADYLSVLATDQLHAMAMLFLNAYGFGSLVWGVFFGLHLAVIGYLILNATYFPKFLGILFLFASFGYLVDSFGNFLFPQYDAVYTVIVLATVPAELAFAFWLLIKGINVESREISMPKFA